ncbi:hypothetical protein HDA32_003425 [Spinactinospora alkalitolerans]|uniref:Uncharacterized protein n=1 Tax=Spinactinospora alkalitolerans TaxID=687207 RepID=A0A852TY90_9ACTN|nr:hypothetical protein [Spinactinospora alkalitolerans]NYE48305.1 hypothetical protein [Spinactinospora alkalitolerans]
MHDVDAGFADRGGEAQRRFAVRALAVHLSVTRAARIGTDARAHRTVHRRSRGRGW